MYVQLYKPVDPNLWFVCSIRKLVPTGLYCCYRSTDVQDYFWNLTGIHFPGGKAMAKIASPGKGWSDKY